MQLTIGDWVQTVGPDGEECILPVTADNAAWFEGVARALIKEVRPKPSRDFAAVERQLRARIVALTSELQHLRAHGRE